MNGSRLNSVMIRSIRSVAAMNNRVSIAPFSVSHTTRLGSREHKSSAELHLNKDKDTLGTMERENKNIETGAHPGEIEHVRQELEQEEKLGRMRSPIHSAEDATTGPLHQAVDKNGSFDDTDTIIDFSG